MRFIPTGAPRIPIAFSPETNEQNIELNDEDESEQEIIDFANRNRQRIEDLLLNWTTLRINFSLENIKNVLYVGLHQFFDEFEIDIIKCPPLTEPPYNFAADGLSGFASVFDLGKEYNNLIPVPLKDKIYDMRGIIRHASYDSFIIGTGYAARESMPSNGHLTINATISRNISRDVINNSRIVYEEANSGRRILKHLNDPNEMKCSMLCNIFQSAGIRRNVIKVCAKGRRSNYDIITLIQKCLYHYYPEDTIGKKHFR